MNRFHIIDDAAVILRSRGVYRQAKVYLRGADLYAGHGAGFIRLYAGGGTGLPSVSWDDIDLIDWDIEKIVAGPMGKLSVPPKRMAIEQAK